MGETLLKHVCLKVPEFVIMVAGMTPEEIASVQRVMKAVLEEVAKNASDFLILYEFLISISFSNLN